MVLVCTGLVAILFERDLQKERQSERQQVSLSLGHTLHHLEELRDFLVWRLERCRKSTPQAPQTNVRFLLDNIPLPAPRVLSLIVRYEWHPVSYQGAPALLKREQSLLFHAAALFHHQQGRLTLEVPLALLNTPSWKWFQVVDVASSSAAPPGPRILVPRHGEGPRLVVTPVPFSEAALFLRRHGAALLVLSFGGLLLSLLMLALNRWMGRERRRRDLWRLLRHKQGVIHATLHASRENLKHTAHFSDLCRAAQTTGDRLAAMIVERSRILHSAALGESTSPSPLVLDKQALLGDPQPQSFHLSEIVAEVCTLVAPLCWENNNELHVHNTAPASLVWVDGVMLRVILANLLEQRVQHLPRGSSLSLGVKRAKQTLRLQILDQGYDLTHCLLPELPLPQNAFSLSAPELDILCFKAELVVESLRTHKGEHRLTLHIPRSPQNRLSPSPSAESPSSLTSSPPSNLIPFPQEDR
jgi:hypothetical protein